jgi:SAM-dependent methyltransferase
MQSEILKAQRAAWKSKPALRSLYHNWHKDILSWLTVGETIEIGCGIGQLREMLPSIKTLDISLSKWTDIVGDAQQLPIKSESIANMVLFDVLHHLPKPVLFFREAFRTLKPEGRLVIVDPYISFLSNWVYRNFHPEPVIMDCDPLSETSPLSSDRPFDSNQAIATILFYKQLEKWKAAFPGYRILYRHRFAQLAYPATGGFGGNQLIPDGVIRLLEKLENHLTIMSKLMAFRTMIVIEKI